MVAKNKLFLTLALVLALAAGGLIISKLLAPPPLAPALNVTTITGQKIADADWRGKVVLINFWATSCVTCVKEMPTLVELHKKYASRGYDTVAIAMSYDRPDFVLNFTKTRDLPFKVVLDLRGEHAGAFDKVQVTPTSFLLDKQGRVLKRWLGEPDVAALSKAIEAAL